jgi:hypothetical protein
MLVILPLTLLIIVLIPLCMILNGDSLSILLGGGIPTTILSLSLIIGTLVKSNWSLLYRLPMSILLLASTVGGWVGLFL